ncbi:MAG TPA: ATP-binding protein [Thermoanaerobaculia bacterium]|nr:ATP-binding protein [Thermoanaerobaculia bacterium]
MGLASIERLPLARKGMLLFLLLALAQLAFAAVLIAVDRARARDMAAERAVRHDVFAAHVVAGSLIDLQVDARGYLLSGDSRLLERFDRTFQQSTAAVAQIGTASPASRRLREAAEACLALQRSVRREIAEGRPDRATAYAAAPAVSRMAAFRTAHVEFNAAEETRLSRRETATRASARGVTTAAIAGAIATLAFVLGIGGALARSASTRLAVILENTRRLERGAEIIPPMPEGDEIAEVDRAFHRMAATLARQKQELKQAHAEVESFAYSVSHDLRAPLRAVSGYAEMLDEDCGEQLDGTARGYVASMRSEAARMGQLIDDLLRFSRVSRQPLNLHPLDIGGIAKACMAELRAASPGRRMIFSLDELPPAAGDPALIRVVLNNLLSNAVKYTAGRDVGVIRLSGGIEGGECVFSVQDNGVGFDMRYASKLFTVFQRLHRDDEFEGTGVGLALVARIIERHGGRVTAAGAIGSGATFTFTLPRAAEVLNAA